MCDIHTIYRHANLTEEVDVSVTLLPDGDSCRWRWFTPPLNSQSVKEHSLEMISVAFTFIFESLMLLHCWARGLGVLEDGFFFVLVFVFCFFFIWPETRGMFHRNWIKPTQTSSEVQSNIGILTFVETLVNRRNVSLATSFRTRITRSRPWNYNFFELNYSLCEQDRVCGEFHLL